MSDEQFKHIEDVWKQYKKNPEKSEELKLSILDQVKNNPSNMWSVFFEADKAMCHRIQCVEILQEAERYKTAYLEKTLGISWVVDYAHVTSEYHDGKTPGLDPEKVKIWHSTFKDIPEFAPAFQEEIEQSEKRLQDIMATIQLPKNEMPPLVETVSFNVPYQFTCNGEIMAGVHEGLLNQLVEDYNSFDLHGYMQLPFKCIGTSVEAKDSWVFNFDIGEVLEGEQRVEALKQLKSELAGQLSDGWGESMEQTEVLEGVDLYRPGFDYDKITLVSPKKEVKKNR